MVRKKVTFNIAILYCGTIRASDRSLNNGCKEYRVRTNYFLLYHYYCEIMRQDNGIRTLINETRMYF